MAYEDLIILVSGNGARSVGAVYDEPVKSTASEAMTIRVTDSTSSQIEILDSVTGQSIATRQLDPNGFANFANYGFELRGDAGLNDQFTMAANINAAGDNQNINSILALQTSDSNGAGSGGFQKIFNTIVAGVGASVQSGDISLQAAEANRDAAAEAETQFSGVNLDTEAAALMEFQQAYQASARILSTARELFQALMDVV
jgi:flagellar hook-associated protein 1 FlgK